MAEVEADGVTDQAEGNLRMALMTSAQLARTASNARRGRLEQATRRDLDEARQLQARIDADRSTARAELAPVHEASWWDQADVGQVARVYETAVTWRDEDETARAAESRIRQELRERYGIEVNESSADPAVVRAELGRHSVARQEREAEREQGRIDQDLAVGLTIEADVLELQADAADGRDARALRDEAAALEEHAEVEWDSAVRREEHADRINQAGEPAAAAAWKQADVDQARHPNEAIRGTRPRSPRAKTKVKPGRTIDRGR
ncbi:MAG: hypothetical protein KF727_15245 [Microbacteriaceae bacterium]|nr:hypothetical protein [Microbacteriaceae bacterium]